MHVTVSIWVGREYTLKEITSYYYIRFSALKGQVIEQQFCFVFKFNLVVKVLIIELNWEAIVHQQKVFFFNKQK